MQVQHFFGAFLHAGMIDYNYLLTSYGSLWSMMGRWLGENAGFNVIYLQQYNAENEHACNENTNIKNNMKVFNFIDKTCLFPSLFYLLLHINYNVDQMARRMILDHRVQGTNANFGPVSGLN